MRLGPLEIILIIAVIIAIAVIARIARSRGSATSRERPKDRDAAARSEGNPGRVQGLLNKTGIVLVIGGAAAFIAAVSLFRMVLQGYLWAFILVAVGLILVLISRRKG
jgi:hypothetical protein